MAGICDGGSCTNVDGGVMCECPEGFVLGANGMKCIDTRQDHCYDVFSSGECGDYYVYYDGSIVRIVVITCRRSDLTAFPRPPCPQVTVWRRESRKSPKRNAAVRREAVGANVARRARSPEPVNIIYVLVFEFLY